MNKDKDRDELVLCIYDDEGVSINEKILEIFSKYIKSSLQNHNF
jgi:hypothetical protein